MQLLFFLLLCIGLSLQQATAPAGTSPQPTGVTTETCQFPPLFGNIPSLFNVFIFDSFAAQQNITIGGRLAANYNVTLGSGSSVATQLLVPLCAPNTTTGGPISANNLNASESNWFYSVVTNGILDWSNGTLGSGTIVVGANNTNNESTAGINNLQCPGFQVLQQSNFIDFEMWENYFVNLSQKLWELRERNETNAMDVTLQNGTLIFPTDINSLVQNNTGGASSDDGLENVQVFNLQAADLLNATAIQFGNTSSNTTSGGNLKAIVFNVQGTPCGWSHDISGLEQLQQFSSKLLWNFVNCTSLQITNVTNIPGSVLAPKAEVTALDTQGELFGQLFAESFTGTLNFNNTKFDGCFQVQTQNATTPTSQGTQAGTQAGTSVVPGTTPAKRNVEYVINDEQQDGSSAMTMTVSVLAASFALLVAMIM